MLKEIPPDEVNRPTECLPHGALQFFWSTDRKDLPWESPDQKVAVVAEVQESFSNAEAVILTEYRGLDVTDMAILRAAMKQAGGEYKVYKNTLVRVAAKELNLEIKNYLLALRQ